jgi:hypothetical protein
MLSTRIGGVAQGGHLRLLSKCEALSSNPDAAKKKKKEREKLPIEWKVTISLSHRLQLHTQPLWSTNVASLCKFNWKCMQKGSSHQVIDTYWALLIKTKALNSIRDGEIKKSSLHAGRSSLLNTEPGFADPSGFPRAVFKHRIFKTVTSGSPAPYPSQWQGVCSLQILPA